MEAGYSTLFLTLGELNLRLARARATGRLEATLAQLARPKLFILDELGYLPFSREEASALFRLLFRRYERGSVIITSNKGVGEWGEYLSDPTLAAAILGRFLHHCHVVNIKGGSYRLKEQSRAKAKRIAQAKK